MARRKNGQLSLPMKSSCFTTPLAHRTWTGITLLPIRGIHSHVPRSFYNSSRVHQKCSCFVSSSLQTTFIDFPPHSFYCPAQKTLPLF